MPTSIYLANKISGLSSHTKLGSKIFYSKKQIPDEIWTHTSKSQVEKTFGGEATPLKSNEYWPPCVPNQEFALPNTKLLLMTIDEYKRTIQQEKEILGTLDLDSSLLDLSQKQNQ